MNNISTPADLKQEFEALISNKSYLEAIQLLEEQYQLHKEQLGSHHIHTIELILMIGDVFLLIPNYARALERFIEAKNLSEAALGNDHILLAQSYKGMAKVYQLQNLRDEANSFFIKAFQVLKEKQHLPTYSECARVIADYAAEHDDPKTALVYYEKALSSIGLADDQRPNLTLHVYMLRLSDNDSGSNEIKIDYTQLFEVIEHIPLVAADAELLSKAYMLLAIESAECAEYRSMQKFYLRYLEARRMRDDFTAFYNVRNEVLEIHDSLNTQDQAVEFLEQLNSICRDWPVAATFSIENSLELAHRQVALENIEQARETLIQSQIALESLDQPLLSASVQHDLGCVCFVAGELEQAKELIHAAQQIRAEFLKADDPALIKSVQALKMVEKALSSNSLDSATVEAGATANVSQQPQPAAPQVASPETNIAYAQAMEMLSQNKPYEALDLLNRLLVDLQSKFGSKDKNLIPVMQQIAIIYKQIGFSHQAQQILNQIQTLED